ncbi:MAG: hypothetical protein ABI402_21105 [Ferruginibacter sp.]
MNYIRHLNAFFSFVRCDKRLTSSHVSLYMALFQCWNINRFKNPFPIAREESMNLSAIGSKNTYHKSLKELHQFGYIYYRASVNKFHKSTVHIVKLDNGDVDGDMKQLDLFSPTSGSGYAGKNVACTSPNPVQVKNSVGIKIDTVPVPILTFASPKFDTVPVPYLGLLIKHKHINSKQEREKNSLTQKIFSKNKKLQEGINAFSGAPKTESPKESSSLTSPFEEGSGVRPSSFPSPSGEGLGVRPSSHPSPFGDEPGVRPSSTFQKPLLNHVLTFFSENNYPAPEAHKFFNHYQSNGWLVAGKTPMQDWRSSANKWMINSSNFQTVQKPNNGNHEQGDINIGQGKNYSQPL